MFKNLLNRLLGLIIAIIFLGGWLIMPNKLKGVVFFWSFPIVGILGLGAFLFGSQDDKKE
jgi:hypothetical protein